jgi:D-arabinose 1-dehydrogenase-like Zn-dependent alcohol dehydrogenase
MSGSEATFYRTLEGKVTATKEKVPDLGPNDILVRITHSGVCFTDREFFRVGAPLALGHEGIGIVEAIGGDVKEFKVGDRAGGGFHRNSCGHCNYCLSGNDIHCNEREIYGEKDYNNGNYLC